MIGDTYSSVTKILIRCRQYQRWQSAAVPSVRAAGNTEATETPVPAATFAQGGTRLHTLLPFFLLSFSPFTAVSLCGVAGLAETLPFHSVNLPGFRDSPDMSFHLYLCLPLGCFSYIFISAFAVMFSVSGLLFMCPNHFVLLMTIAIALSFASLRIMPGL